MKLEINKKFQSRSDRVKGIDFHPTEPWVLTTLYSGRLEIWSYETGAKIKSIEVTEVPVRAGRFIARKNWVVVGSDDFHVRVYNYNTGEKVAQFEAHPDYIRSIAVHPTRPYVLTCSDDMTIKLWNWDNNWKLEQTFEGQQGHQHYIMSLAFNPKDPNTFASACLDHTVKIWSLGNSVPNFTMVAHEQKGVNYVSYYPGSDKPYIITASDDKTVKVWDYQTKSLVATLEGHSANVSFAVFHPELPLIISGSEDATLKVWNASTYKLERTLNYGLERAWCVSTSTLGNSIAVGFDSGFAVLQLGNDEPKLSMDPVGKLIWSKNSEVYSSVIKGSEDIQDGETLPLSSKDLGSVEVFPTSLKHSPNGRFVTVTGDGEYIIYTALAWRNKHYGAASDFVWASDSNVYAIKDPQSGHVSIHKNFKPQANGDIDFVYSVDKLYGGALLGIKSDGFVAFFDWETAQLVRRIDVDATDVVWSESGELVLISSADALYVLTFDKDTFTEALENNQIDPEEGVEESFDVLFDVNETIQSGKWVGDVFIYTTTSNRLNYLVGGKVYNIAHFDKPNFILGYLARDNRVYVADKDVNVSSYHLSLSVLEYQTLVLRGDIELANQDYLESFEESDLLKVSRFLEAQGYEEEALEISPDSEQKFDIALKLKNFDIAKEIAVKDNTEHKWKALGDLALSSFRYKVAIESFKNANDLESLLLLYTSFNQKSKLDELAEQAKAVGKYNVAFNAYWTSGNVTKAVELLQLSDRPVEASFLGLSYGADISKPLCQWKESLEKINKGAIAERISTPGVDEGFPARKEVADLVDLDEEEAGVQEEKIAAGEEEEVQEDIEEEEVLEDAVEEEE